MDVRIDSLEPPTEAELLAISDDYGFSLDRNDLEVLADVLSGSVEAFVDVAEQEPESPGPLDTEVRSVSEPPGAVEDPHNAWLTVCEVRAGDGGPLAGMAVGLKDNISLAGVPMTCGSALFSDYVPSSDATVVRRILAAGATIVGKLNMPAFAMTASGDLCDFGGRVLNPHDPSHLAGGSSSGAAVAVVTGDVDVAIGTDQGGSIRIPAAWCGCVGHKPTYGLVPYSWIASTGPSVDHVGPMVSTVDDAALVLDCIAGRDGLDPRQADIDVELYSDSLDEEFADGTVGVLVEGFGTPHSDPSVDEAVRDAVATLGAAGNDVREVSVPLHRVGKTVRQCISVEETVALVRDEGVGRYLRGAYDEEYAQRFATARRQMAERFPVTLQAKLMLGEYLSREYPGQMYARAQNLRLELARAYDAAFDDVDVLVMPTTPMTAFEADESMDERSILTKYAGVNANTAPFNSTGHPAISVPVGTVGGLPVGLMIVGKRLADGTVLRAAKTLESRTPSVRLD